MRLIVLGCCAAMAAAGRRCSGYLVELGGGRFWLDAGSGTLGELLRHTTLDELDALFVGHLHADHWTDLPLAVHTLKQIRTGPDRLPVLAPPGFVDQTGVPLRDQLESSDPVYEPHDLHDGWSRRFDGVRLTARRVEHGDIESFGVRLDTAEATLAYSGDTGPCQALNDLASGANVLLCEAGAAGDPTPGHLTPEQVGELARLAGVKTVVLTHLPHDADVEHAVARARAAFDGDVVAARDGAVFTF